MKKIVTPIYIMLLIVQVSEAQPLVNNLTVVNSDSDTDIRDIPLTIDTVYMDQNVTIRAKVSGTVESVRFYLDDVLALNENNSPYGLTGNTNGDFDKWRKSPGLYKVSALAFTGNSGTGTKSDTFSRLVRVIWPNDTTVHIPYTLVDATHDVDIRPLHENDTIVLAPGDKITIKVKPVYAKSVEYIINGIPYRVENASPYSLEGNVSGNFYPWRGALPGHYTLVVKVYSDYTADGMIIQNDTLHFVILEDPTLSLSGFHNPYLDHSSLNISSDADQEVQITLLDILGKKYFEQTSIMNVGQNSIPINMNDFYLSPGIYFVKIRSEEDEKVIKFYKE